jgi:8-oxo-dGTP pyrophosphatase MutT (NUDIX family)
MKEGERLRSIDLALVRRALSGSLPGFEAQRSMAPERRPLGPGLGPGKWRDAAVIIALYPVDGKIFFPLTLRTEDIAHHKGQVSLPGGSRENGESLADTALREAREEIGIGPEGIEILAGLSPLEVPPSGFRIHPFVAALSQRPVFRLQEQEVAELIEAPLELLVDPAFRKKGERSHAGESFPVPLFQVGRHEVWGATAMILAELAYMLRRQLSSDCQP